MELAELASAMQPTCHVTSSVSAMVRDIKSVLDALENIMMIHVALRLPGRARTLPVSGIQAAKITPLAGRSSTLKYLACGRPVTHDLAMCTLSQSCQGLPLANLNLTRQHHDGALVLVLVVAVVVAAD